MARSAGPGQEEGSAAPEGRGGVAAPREPGQPPASFEKTDPRQEAPASLAETQPRHGLPAGLEDTQPRRDRPPGFEALPPRGELPDELGEANPRPGGAAFSGADDSTAHTPIEPPPAPTHEPTLRKDPLVGQRVGHYELRNRLGVGGMSVVYEAVEPLIGKRVAVKVLRPELSAEPHLVERLLAEARAVNAIRHRGIIDIYAFGTLNDGRPYVVMEYLEGQPLDEWLRAKGSVSPVEVLPHLVELLGALSAAHAAGVVHCDLKPGNVFLVHQPDGTRYVKVLDFGLSWRRVAGGALRAKGLEGLAAGTPDFMAPEQVRGEAPTPATDLYAVGVIAYTLLTGQRLFRGEGAEVMRQHATQPPRPMRQLQPALPPELDTLVLSLLAKRPQDRPASAESVRQEFDRLRRTLELEALGRRGEAVAAPPTQPGRPAEPASGPMHRLSSLLEAPTGAVAHAQAGVAAQRLRTEGSGATAGRDAAFRRRTGEQGAMADGVKPGSAPQRHRTDGRGTLVGESGSRGDEPSSQRRRTEGRSASASGVEGGSGSGESPHPRRRTDGSGVLATGAEGRAQPRGRAFAPTTELEEERVPVHPRTGSTPALETRPAQTGAAPPASEPQWNDVTPLAWDPENRTELIRPLAFHPPEAGEDETVRASDAALGPLLPRWAWGLILLSLLGALFLWWSTSPTHERPGLPEGDRRLLDFDRGARPLR